MKTQKHGGEGQSAPPNRDPVLHFHALRLIALRGGDRNEETPTTENEREMLMHRACARALSPHSLFCCWSTAHSPHPGRSADWPHGPCLALAPCIPEGNS